MALHYASVDAIKPSVMPPSPATWTGLIVGAGQVAELGVEHDLLSENIAGHIQLWSIWRRQHAPLEVDREPDNRSLVRVTETTAHTSSASFT